MSTPSRSKKEHARKKQENSLLAGLQVLQDLNIQALEQEEKLEKLDIIEQELQEYKEKEEDARIERQNTDFESLLALHEGKLPEGYEEFPVFLPEESPIPETPKRTKPSKEFKSAFGRNTSSIYVAEAGQICPHCKYATLEECTSFAGTPCEFFIYCSNCNAFICTYKPMPHQTIYHLDDHSFKLYAGGFGSAKTYTCGMEFLANMLQIPMSQGLVGAATWSQCEDTCLKFVKDNIPMKLVASSKQDKVSWNITLINGSKIYAKALNEEGKIRSANLSFIWIEEGSEVKWSVVAFLKARLRNKVGFFKGKDRLRMLVSSNPDVGWLNTEWLLTSDEVHYHGNVPEKYYIPLEKRDPDVSTHIAATSSNTHLPHDYEEKLARNKPLWWINRYLRGSFKYAEGLVYPNFNDWFCEPFNIPVHWKRITGTDFGRRDPTAHVIAALDPVRKIIYVYNEIEESLDDKSVNTIINKIKHAHNFPPYLLAYPHQADPRGRNRSQTSGESWFDVFREKGLLLVPAEGCETKSLAPTIQKLAEYGESGRLKIFRNCTKTYEALSKYKYPERKLGEEDNQGETPQDKNNHLPDALRYMIAPFMNFPDDVGDFSHVWNNIMVAANTTHNPLSGDNGYLNSHSGETFVTSYMDNFG